MTQKDSAAPSREKVSLTQHRSYLLRANVDYTFYPRVDGKSRLLRFVPFPSIFFSFFLFAESRSGGFSCPLERKLYCARTRARARVAEVKRSRARKFDEPDPFFPFNGTSEERRNI